MPYTNAMAWRKAVEHITSVQRKPHLMALSTQVRNHHMHAAFGNVPRAPSAWHTPRLGAMT
eukprot:475566-Amphidinium_carterae.1